METRSEYRAHHLPADIAYARALPSERTVEQITVRGDVAWVVATSRTQGTYRERTVNSAGAELMVLARENGWWRIVAVHWSSRAVRPAQPGGRA
jgi:ketosteroid isomerase-like protein